MSTINEELKAVMQKGIEQFGGLNAFAKASGVSKVNLSRWMNDCNGATLRSIMPVCNLLDIHISSIDARNSEKNEKICLIKKIIFADKNGIRTEPFVFQKEFLTEAGVAPEHACMMKVNDDAMHPFVSERSYVLMDTSETDLTDKNVYVFNSSGSLHIRRYFRVPVSNESLFRADNTIYPEIRLDGQTAHIEILGRVVMALSFGV